MTVSPKYSDEICLECGLRVKPTGNIDKKGRPIYRHIGATSAWKSCGKKAGIDTEIVTRRVYYIRKGWIKVMARVKLKDHPLSQEGKK